MTTSRRRPKRPTSKRPAEPHRPPPGPRLPRLSRRAGIALGVVAVVATAVFLVTRLPHLGDRIGGLDPNSLAPSADLYGTTAGKVRFEDFVGSDSCQTCHPREYDMWKNSTHYRAGGDPDKVAIIARFDGRPLEFKDAIVTPSKDNQGKYRFAVRQAGQPERVFEVSAVVGGGHMNGGGTQSFFQRFPDGTLRFLPFDFIRKENEWFVQLRADGSWAPVSRDIALADLAQWPPNRALGTSADISTCQNCHGSQILLEGEPADGFSTRYATLQIDCEACHGPSRRHVELSRKPDFAKMEDIGLDALGVYDKDGSVNVCFRCHALKDALRDDFLPGDPLEDYFSLRMPALASEPNLPDGRVREFAYQQNHLFSDCYLNGSMTCVDCHDPHSQQYRDIYGRSLVGRFDNGQCTSCHFSKERHPERHSGHRPDSTGNRCVSCHMPYLQHKGMGKRLVFARSDHVIPIPRPVHDTAEGIEDACTKCHRKWSVDSLQALTDRWWGEVKPLNRVTRGILQAESERDIEAAARLLLHPEVKHPMGQVLGMGRLAKNFLGPDMPRFPKVVADSLKRLAESANLDVKAMALMTLHLVSGNDGGTRAYLARQLRALGPQERAVRDRWAMAQDFLGTHYAVKGRLTDAVRTHRKALEIKPDDPLIWLDLAQDYRDMRDPRSAIPAYERAIRIRPRLADPRFQLAEMYAATGRRREALEELRIAAELDPADPRARALPERQR